MNILNLRVANVDLGVPDFARAANGYSVADAILNGEPLSVELKGYVAGDLNTKYNPPSFMLELDEYSVERLVDVETLFFKRFDKELLMHPFKTCIAPQNQVRLKLHTDKKSGEYNFDVVGCRKFTPREIINGLYVMVRVLLKFYVSKERSGMFLTLECLEILD